MKSVFLKKWLFLSVTLLSSILLFSFIASPYQNWVVPAEYKNKVNPVKGKNLEAGKGLYNKHCKICHGAAGEGGTPKAKTLKYTGKIKLADIKNQTDGELYYKSIIGRLNMPNFEKKITVENDRWGIINHMRTFK